MLLLWAACVVMLSCSCWVCECLLQTPLSAYSVLLLIFPKIFCLAFDWHHSYFYEQNMQCKREHFKKIWERRLVNVWRKTFPFSSSSKCLCLWRRVFLLSYDNVSAFHRQITCHRHSVCPPSAQSNKSSFQIDWDKKISFWCTQDNTCFKANLIWFKN